MKPPNAWGLFDMSGNVSEVTWDRFGANYYSSSASEDPEGPDTGDYRVARGGAVVDSEVAARVSSRSNESSWYSPDYAGAYKGFRLVRTVP